MNAAVAVRPRPLARWATAIALAVIAGAAQGQPVPPPITREFRAAWVSPTEASDWPSRPGLSVDEQKAELRTLMEQARANGLNAVLLHIRPAGDALYPTRRAPWSRYLLGRGTGEPDSTYDEYDPLALAIDEAHARGLQLHVWFNPFRAMPPDDLGAPGRGHVTRTHPGWVRKYGKSTWIDPGIPAARRAVLDAILEVVDRYDVDGVHIDDYFYPYLEQQTITRTVKRGRKRVRVGRRVTIRFPDNSSWKRYGLARGWTNRDDWRRANVDDFVRTLYREVKTRKSWVLVGISPFGIWRPGYPAGVTGLNAYTEIFADSRKWLRQGWLDYLAPQLYWRLDGDQERFTKLDAWWRGENVKGRHIWPGLFTMRVGSRTDPWPRDEIAREIAVLRDARNGTSESQGHVHFRLRTLDAWLDGDDTTFGALLRDSAYPGPALPLASPLLGATPPGAPVLTGGRAGPVRLAGGSAGNVDTDSAPDSTASMPALVLAPSDSVAVRWWLIQTLGSDGLWSSRLLPVSTARIALPRDSAAAAWIAVTAISRTGVAGRPSLWPADSMSRH